MPLLDLSDENTVDEDYNYYEYTDNYNVENIYQYSFEDKQLPVKLACIARVGLI